MSKWIAVTAATLALGAGGVAWTHHVRRPDDGVQRFAATGVVVAPPEGPVVRIAHDDIPGYMPAMTMAFAVADGEPPRAAPGDRVRFTLRVTPDRVYIEGVTVTGHETSAGPAALAPVTRLKRGDTLPPLMLVGDNAGPITTDDLRGHATVVTFIFTRCPVPEFCPLVVTRFKELQGMLARDASASGAQLLAITLDPTFDTPAVLRNYARAVGADPARWRFAGGDPGEVQRVARAFSVHVERNGALLDHTLATALIDDRGRVVEIWRGNGWKAKDVLEAMTRVRAG